MEGNKYISIGFMFLCLALLVGMIGVFGYQLFINKEKVEVSPATYLNQSNNSTHE